MAARKHQTEPTSVLVHAVQVAAGQTYNTTLFALAPPAGMAYEVISVTAMAAQEDIQTNGLYWIISRQKSVPATIIAAQGNGVVAAGRGGFSLVGPVSRDSLLLNDMRISVGKIGSTVMTVARTMHLSIEVALVRIDQATQLNILSES